MKTPSCRCGSTDTVKTLFLRRFLFLALGGRGRANVVVSLVSGVEAPLFLESASPLPLPRPLCPLWHLGFPLAAPDFGLGCDRERKCVVGVPGGFGLSLRKRALSECQKCPRSLGEWGRVVQKWTQPQERSGPSFAAEFEQESQASSCLRKGTPLASRVAQGVSGPSSSCVWNPRVFADDAR